MVLDARHAGFPDSVFTDPVHLDRDGAAALSLSVAHALDDALARGPAAASWVDLPTFTPPPGDLNRGLEDYVQSIMAVRERVNSVRK